MKVRIHYTTGDGLATCRMPLVLTTEDAAQVTCRLCERALAAVAARVEAERDRRGDTRPAVLDGPGRSEVGGRDLATIARSIAGEPVDTSPPYWSAAAFYEAIAIRLDVARSMASGSDWDRIGSRTIGRTPTTPKDMHDRSTDLDLCWAAGVRPMTIGNLRIASKAVSEILTLRLLGKAVAHQVMERIAGREVPRKKSTVVKRVSVDAATVAEMAGLTRHQVAIVVRHGRAAQLAEAARKGLVPQRVAQRQSERTEETSMAAVAGYDLEGWKDISTVTARGVTWCREQAKRADDPLPVKYYAGRVVAKRAEVSAWVLRQVEAA